MNGVETQAEQAYAASTWLLGAAPDADKASQEWNSRGYAWLSCGGIIAAVRIPGSLVFAAADTAAFEEVDDYLLRELGGPVIGDLYAHQFYALVPSSAAWRWRDWDSLGAECLGKDHLVGVPAMYLTAPEGHLYWSVPLQGAGELCDPAAVRTLLSIGRMRRGRGQSR